MIKSPCRGCINENKPKAGCIGTCRTLQDVQRLDAEINSVAPRERTEINEWLDGKGTLAAPVLSTGITTNTTFRFRYVASSLSCGCSATVMKYK